MYAHHPSVWYRNDFLHTGGVFVCVALHRCAIDSLASRMALPNEGICQQGPCSVQRHMLHRTRRITIKLEPRKKPRHTAAPRKTCASQLVLVQSSGRYVFLSPSGVVRTLRPPHSSPSAQIVNPSTPTDEGPGRHAAVREAAGGGRGGGLEEAEATSRQRGQEAQDDQPRPQGGVRRPPAAAQGPPDVGVAARAVTNRFRAAGAAP